MDVFATEWRQAVTATPIENATEGGSVILLVALEGASPLEIAALPYYGDHNWVETSICIFAGSENGRLIETVVQGSFTNEQLGPLAMARTRGFSRQVWVEAGERTLCVVTRVIGSSAMKVYRRYPTVTGTILQTYR